MWVMLLFLMFLCLHNRRSGRTPANHSTHLTNQNGWTIQKNLSVPGRASSSLQMFV